MKLRKKFKDLGRLDSYFNKNIRNTYDTLASLLLHRLFPDHAILPFTPFSLNPNTILHIINEIQINRRRSILEFGAGISTLAIAKYIKKNNLNASIITIEENEDWANFIKEQLIKYECDDKAEVYFLHMKELNILNFKGDWYDKKQLNKIIDDKFFDMLIIDGPGAGKNHLIRYPAVIELSDKLNEDFIVFLDDIRRKGEMEILKKWMSHLSNLGLQVKGSIDKSKVYGTIVCGKAFSANPLSH